MDYLDFTVAIERTATGYETRVESSATGQERSPLVLPFSDLEIENFILKMSQTGRGQRRVEMPMVEAAKDFGDKLFQATFHDATYFCLRKAQQEAAAHSAGLRIRLNFDAAPDLAVLPWEYLYNRENNHFLVLSDETPVVRQLSVQDDMPPFPIALPIRILTAICAPSDQDPLDAEDEWRQLNNALKDLQDAGKVVLERLMPPTLPTLQRALRRQDYHVFHFIGHGAFDPGSEQGILMLLDDDGRGFAVTGEQLGINLHNGRTLRLAVLNACEGARTAKDDPFAGVAQSILQQGIPAVVAMQFPITDNAARSFAREFYTAMTDGLPADAALTQGRTMVYNEGSGAEWGTPVLYLAGQDSQIFTLPPSPALPATRVPPPPPPQSPAPPQPLPLQPRKWLAVALVALAAVALLVIAAPQVKSLFQPPTRVAVVTQLPPTTTVPALLAATNTSEPLPATSTPTGTASPSATVRPPNTLSAPSTRPILIVTGTLTVPILQRPTLPILTPIKPIHPVLKMSPTPCPITIEQPFAALALQLALGCPTRLGRHEQVVWQDFEKGSMFWRSEADKIVYVLDNTHGAAHGVAAAHRLGGLDACFGGPNGSVKVQNGFGWLWCGDQAIRDELGEPTMEERKDDGQNTQYFENGWVGETPNWADGGMVGFSKDAWAKR